MDILKKAQERFKEFNSLVEEKGFFLGAYHNNNYKRDTLDEVLVLTLEEPSKYWYPRNAAFIFPSISFFSSKYKEYTLYPNHIEEISVHQIDESCAIWIPLENALEYFHKASQLFIDLMCPIDTPH
jgi:hypothetical protein